MIGPAESAKSYIVETPLGEVLRNRSQLNVVPESGTETLPESTAEDRDTNAAKMHCHSFTNRNYYCPTRLELN